MKKMYLFLGLGLALMLAACASSSTGTGTNPGSGTGSGGGTTALNPTALTDTLIATKMVISSGKTYDSIYKASISAAGELGTMTKIVQYNEDRLLMPTYGLDISNDGKWIWLGIGTLGGLDIYSESIYGCCFYKMSIDGDDATAQTITGATINATNITNGTGTMNITVTDGGLAVNAAQITIRGGSTGTTGAAGTAQVTSVPVFNDGVSWVHVYGTASGKYGYDQVIFTGSTLDVSVSLTTTTFPSANRVAVNGTYKVLGLGVASYGVYPLTNSGIERTLSNSYSNISPTANNIYYSNLLATTNNSNYRASSTLIYKYDISADTSTVVYDIVSSIGAGTLSTLTHQLEFSADGTKLYFVYIPTGGGTESIYAMDLTSFVATLVYTSSTTGGVYMGDLAISPDGTYVFFVKSSDIYRARTDGTTAADGADRLTTTADIGLIATTLE